MSKNDGILSMVKLGLILSIYAVASCTVLAVVNNFTSPKIQQNQIIKATKAMGEVFSDADDFDLIADFPASSNSAITFSDAYLAKKDGKVIGGVVQIAGPTYDKGKIIVGVGTDGVVHGMRFLELTDSPGFGSKAKDPSYTVKSGKTFYEQFTGKDANKGFVINETFDAITGATITSNGVAKLMNAGTESLLKYLGEHHYE